MPNVKVSIPVSVGGYTGQRDQWESSTWDYEVTVDDAKIALTGVPDIHRKIEFDLTELEKAVKFYRQHGQEA